MYTPVYFCIHLNSSVEQEMTDCPNYYFSLIVYCISAWTCMIQNSQFTDNQTIRNAPTAVRGQAKQQKISVD